MLTLDQLRGVEGVYLLHFDAALAGHARHYMGFASDIAARIERHMRGDGAALMAACKREGIGFTVARVWPGLDRHGERALKRRKNSPELCPICQAQRPLHAPESHG